MTVRPFLALGLLASCLPIGCADSGGPTVPTGPNTPAAAAAAQDATPVKKSAEDRKTKTDNATSIPAQ